MARGVKPTKDRKSVRSITVGVRFNDYELEELYTCLDILQDKRTVSAFIRDLVNDKCQEMSKDIGNDKTP